MKEVVTKLLDPMQQQRKQFLEERKLKQFRKNRLLTRKKKVR